MNFYHTYRFLFIFGLLAVAISCSTTKRVPKNKRLLIENTIKVNDTLPKDEIPYSLLSQKRNTKFLGIPFRLGLGYLAKKNADSSYMAWLNKKPNRKNNLVKLLSEKQVNRLGKSFLVSGYSNFFKKLGEEPVVLDESKLIKSKKNLMGYYFNNGYFNTQVTHTLDTFASKKVKINFVVKTGKPFVIDSITEKIETPELALLFAKNKQQSLIKPNQIYKTERFDNERKRITSYFQNNGVFYFRESDVLHKLDTINTHGKVNVTLKISNPLVKSETSDSLVAKPFQIFNINKVAVFVDNATIKNTQKYTDTLTYKNITFYSTEKLNYKPQALANAIFIEKDSLFSEKKRTLTSQALSNLKQFQYPNIQFLEDSTEKDNGCLNTNIFLTPYKKFSLSPSIDFTYSNIINFGISGEAALTIRNIFRGAENLEIAAQGSIGSSKHLSNPDDVFFNLSEYGVDFRLHFPRIFFPINTSRIIKREMMPTTRINFSLNRQINIGLDKENFSGALNYAWQPRKNTSFRVDLVNAQFVRNLNILNYFTVYKTSYTTLNLLAQTYNSNPTYWDASGNLTDIGAILFIYDAVIGNTAVPPTEQDLKIIRSIGERFARLVEDNLIVSTNVTFSKTSKTDNLDVNYYTFKTKLEAAGNTLALISNFTKDPLSNNKNQTIFNVEYSQYVKAEVEFSKHTPVFEKSNFAFRVFAGFAIPYGNSDNIPFSRSYFAGGANDNRAWQAYRLGPGRSGGIDDYNEANLKVTFNAEYRFNILGKLNGALFTDVGNIWNALDDVTEEEYRFEGIQSLKDLAVSSGVGMRYDFGFFVFRLDWGFKTYNPARPENTRWLKDFTISQSVLNFGINYPF